MYLTWIFTFFGFSIELCVFNSTLPWSAQFLRKAAYVFKVYQSVHLSVMHAPARIFTGLLRPSLDLPFNLRMTGNEESHQDVTNAVCC